MIDLRVPPLGGFLSPASTVGIHQMTSVETTAWNGRGGVEMKNDRIAVIVVCGGGHIVSLRAVDASSKNVPDVNPLWTPSWPTADPALRKLACQSGMQPGELEGELLCGISGMNLCCELHASES